MARIRPQTLLQQSKKKKGPTRISLTTIILFNVFVVVIILALVATYRHWSQRSRSRLDLEDGDGITQKDKFDIPSYVILDTTKGSITVELFKEASPETIDDFINLCQKGHFKGMPFRRVIKNSVIQAGDSQIPEAAADWMLKPQNQLVLSTKHEAFMLGTSRTVHDNKGFDLFITTALIPELNDKLVVFGQVIKGENVVQEIEEVDTDEHYLPRSPIAIINVTLRREN